MKKRDIIKRKNDVTIAVIDDGIESEEYLCFDLEVIGCSVEQRKYKEKNEELTHGTLCYKVLREYGNGCNIGSIKIMGNNRKEDVLDAFIVAVKWCVENYIDIIHISLGICSVNAYTQLRNALAEFFVQGGLIVASIDNTEKYTLPAAFSFVFAVRRNDTLKQGEIQMEYSEKYGKNIMEIGTVCMLEKYERLRLVRCNSYTTPVLTAEISRLIRSKQKNFYKVKKYFYNHKENIYRPDFIQNVIIFGTKEKSDKWIFFSIIKYVESIKQISDYKIKRRYILFIRKNIKISELKKLKKNLIAIFYPQKRDKILYEWCQKNEILIWDENSYIDSLILQQKRWKSHSANDTFVLEIYNTNIEIMVKIARLFIEKGYNSWAMSNMKKSYLYGIDYIPECFLQAFFE